MSKKIGLFFGSFNPIHVGHLIIANSMINHSDLEQIWLIVSPHNPFKERVSLAKDRDRLHLAHLAIGDHPQIKPSDIEFNLPKPSYTIDTLAYLEEKYPHHTFSIIMGGDNLPTLPNWKNGDVLLNRYQIYVYKRPGYDVGPLGTHPNIHLLELPLLDISSTYIRTLLAEKKSIRYLVPEPVREYIESSGMYKK